MDLIRAQKEVELLERDGATRGEEALHKNVLAAFRALGGEPISPEDKTKTLNLLSRLVRDLPLTPLVEEDFDENSEGTTVLQGEINYSFRKFNKIVTSERCPYVFKYCSNPPVYRDSNRIALIDTATHDPVHDEFVSLYIDENYPVEFPYIPILYPSVHAELTYNRDEKGIPHIVTLWSVSGAKTFILAKHWEIIYNEEGKVIEYREISFEEYEELGRKYSSRR